MPAPFRRHRDPWASRLRADGRCLSPGCDAQAAGRFHERWCLTHGEVLARVRAEIGDRQANAERLRSAKLVPSAEAMRKRQEKPAHDPSTCRLDGCETRAQHPGGPCYLHRNVSEDVHALADLPARETCTVDGCENVARGTVRRCKAHPVNPRGPREAVPA